MPVASWDSSYWQDPADKFAWVDCKPLRVVTWLIYTATSQIQTRQRIIHLPAHPHFPTSFPLKHYTFPFQNLTEILKHFLTRHMHRTQDSLRFPTQKFAHFLQLSHFKLSPSVLYNSVSLVYRLSYVEMFLMQCEHCLYR